MNITGLTWRGRLTRLALGLAAFALASSVLATPSLPARPAVAAKSAGNAWQVVVITLDGARFQEIFQGTDAALSRSPHRNAAQLMPQLHRLMTLEGAGLGAPQRGAAISASGPEFVSLPGYSEIFTGRRVTGCVNNGCSGTTPLSVADELAAAGHSVAVLTSWADIARVAAKTDRVTLSCGRHGGATRARLEGEASLARVLRRSEDEAPWPGHDDFRRDRNTAELALAYLRSQRPNFTFIGLGETDEFAHQGDYAGYLSALSEADRFVGEVAALLADRARQGARTALFVTADHGRAASFRDHGKPYPESARVWLAATGSAISARGQVELGSERHLADVAPTLRELFGLRADRGESAGSPLRELGLPSR